MRLIETKVAPNPRRVRIFLAEKGLSVPCEERSLLEGELRTNEFKALNPMQQVPVLILADGTVLSESVAICRYFEEIKPEPALFGRTPLGRATVEMWNRRAELGLFYSVAQVFRHLHPKMAKNEVPQIAAWGEANKPKALAMLSFFDTRLGESPFLAGDEISIADITALVAVDFMKPARIERPPGLANLERWHAMMSARPSAQA